MKYRFLLLAMCCSVASASSAELAPPEPSFVEMFKFIGSGDGVGDSFGQGLVVDGDTMAVAGDRLGPGAAYIYARSEGGPNQWGEVVRITAPDVEPDDEYAYDLALSGETLVVASGDFDGPAVEYIYELDGSGHWNFVKKLESPPVGGTDGGIGVPSIDGDLIVTGARSDDDAAPSAGAAYVFERNEGGPDNWGVVAKLTASDAGNLHALGQDVALYDDTFVIGDAREGAYVFERDASGVWGEVAKLTASDGFPSDKFGRAVAIERNLVAVGASDHDFPVGNGGAVYVFERNFGGPANWGLVTKLIHEDPEVGDLFGVSVAIDERRILVGAQGVDTGTGEATGATFLFEEDENGTWHQIEKIVASDGMETDLFGITVAMSGGTVLIGATGDDEFGFGAGAAYIYQEIAAPQVVASGSCPGEITFSLSGATPGGIIYVITAEAEGVGIPPGGPCAGIHVNLENPRFLGSLIADSAGTTTIQRNAPGSVCGKLLQAMDMTTCGTSNVVEIAR